MTLPGSDVARLRRVRPRDHKDGKDCKHAQEKITAMTDELEFDLQRTFERLKMMTQSEDMMQDLTCGSMKTKMNSISHIPEFTEIIVPSLLPCVQPYHPHHLPRSSLSSSSPSPPRSVNLKKRKIFEEPMVAVEEDDEDDGEDMKESPSSDPSKKRRSKLPLAAIRIFRKWFTDHVRHPYPTPTEKKELARETGLSIKQTNNWFTNTRKRFWVPYMNKLKAAPALQQQQPAQQEIIRMEFDEDDVV